MSRYFYDVSTESRMLDEVAARRRQHIALRASVTPQMAHDAATYADAYPWMNPLVMQSLIQAGLPPDDPNVVAVAGAEAAVAASTGDLEDPPSDEIPDAWYETLLESTAGFFKPAVRTGMTILATPFEELQSLMSAAGTALFDSSEDSDVTLGGQTVQNPLATAGGVISELARPADLISDFWTNYTQKAARSTGLLAVGDLLAGNTPSLGTGWLPAGDIAAERQRDKHRLSLDGQFVTPGRLIARNFVEPGTTAYQGISGAFDFAQNIFLDPVNLAGGAVAKASKAVDLFQAPNFSVALAQQLPLARSLVNGVRKTVDPQQLRHDFLTNEGSQLVDWLTRQDNPMEIHRALGRSDVALATRLADTSDPAVVFDEMMGALGATLRTRPTGTRFSRALGGIPIWGSEAAEYGRMFGAGATVHRALRNTRLAQDMPGHTPISSADLNGAAREVEAWMRNAHYSDDKIGQVVGEIGRLVPGDSVKLNQIALRMLDDTEGILVREWGIDAPRAHDITRMFERRADEMRAFQVDDVGNNIDPMSGITTPVIDGRPATDLAPHPIINADLHTDMFWLPDAREIRRATPTIRKWQGVYDSETWRAGIDLMDGLMSNFWKPAQLLRGAYMVRVLAEEQLRLAGAGYASMGRSPISALAWTIALDPKSRIGQRMASAAKKVIDPRGTASVTGQQWDDIVEHTHAMARRANLTGLPAHVYTGLYTKVHKAEGSAYYQGWADQLMHAANDGVMRRLAAGLSDADLKSFGVKPSTVPPGARTDLDLVNRWFTEGSGRKFRDELAAVDGRQVLATDPAAARQYLEQNQLARLEQLTQGDPVLLGLIANGTIASRLDEAEIAARLAKVNRRLADPKLKGQTRSRLEAEQNRLMGGDVISARGAFTDTARLTRRLTSEFADRGPEYAIRPVIARSRNRRGSLAMSKADMVIEMGFQKIMVDPTNWASRSPAFRQMYYQRIDEMFADATATVQDKIIRGAAEAGMDDAYLGRLRGLRQAGRSGTRFTDIDEIDMLGRNFAANGVKDLLYDLSRRNQFFDMARLIFPFGEAWKEILGAWGGIVRKNPTTVRRFQQAIEGARAPSILPGATPETEPGTGTGFFHPGTHGEEIFTYPARWAGRLIGGLGDVMQAVGPSSPVSRGLSAAGDIIGGEAGVGFAGRATGLNIASATVLPGFGPVVQWPASALLPHTPRFDDLREFLLPFGETEGESVGGQLQDILLPAWIEKVFTSMENPDSHRLFGNTVMHTERALYATGQFDISTPEGKDDFHMRARDAARALFMIRGLAQFGAPTGPEFTWTAEDLEGNVVPVKILSDELRRIVRDEYGGDFEAGVEEWLRRFGVNNILAAVPMTQEHVDRPLTVGGDAWIRGHPDEAERFDLTIGYFAPDLEPDEPGGEFDYTAYINTLEQGTREGIKPREMIDLANDLLGRLQYSHAKEIAALRPGPEMSVWLAKVRESLAEQYPGFGGYAAQKGRERRPATDVLIAQLRQAAVDPVLSETDAGRGLAKYLSAIDAANQMVTRLDGVVRYNTAKAARPIRDWLRSVAKEIIDTHPGFAPMWESVFRRELADDTEI